MAVTLRDYQVEAVDSNFEKFRTVDRVVDVMAVGTGKTTVGAEVVRRWADVCHEFHRPPKVLWLAHLDPLIEQAWERLRDICVDDQKPVIEKGSIWSKRSADLADRRIVCSSMQTMCRPDRLKCWGPDEFGMIVVDEAAHIVCPSYIKIVEYFTSAKFLGLTATPKRADKVSIGQVFQDVGYNYPMMRAINEKWLCHPIQQYLEVELDWSKAKDVGSDYTEEELDSIINAEGPLHQIARGTIDSVGKRQTMIFCHNVATSNNLAVILRDRYGKSAHSITGTMSEIEYDNCSDADRQTLVSDLEQGYREGQYQFLVSCAKYLEGFDAPATSAVVRARPTRSASLAEQMMGRGMRGGPRCPIPGKKDCLVLDFHPGTAKHKLCTCLDVLGGDYEKVVVEAVRRKIDKEDIVNPDVATMLAEMNLHLDELQRERRMQIMAEAKIRRKTLDPLSVFNMESNNIDAPMWEREWPATDDQVLRLKKEGIKTEGSLNIAEAKRLLSEVNRRRRDGLCSYRMARIMRTHGIDPNITQPQAEALVEHFKTKPDGFMGKSDFMRLSVVKKRGGRPFNFAELRDAPRFYIPMETEIEIPNGVGGWKTYKTSRNTFPKRMSKKSDGMIYYTLDYEGKEYHCRAEPLQIVDLKSK